MTTLSMCEHILIQAIGVALYLFTPLWAHLVTLCRLGPKSASVNKIDRFNMSDGMILVTLIAVATTLATNAPIDRYRQNWLLLGSLNLFVILNWYKCGVFMRRKGIVENKSRVAMQLFTYPSAVLSPAFVLVCGLWVLVGVILVIGSHYEGPVAQNLPYSLIFLAISCLWIYLTRLSFVVILKRNQVGDSK